MKNIYDDLSSLDLGTHKARDLAQNQPLWRLTSLQCYAFVMVHVTIGLDWIQGDERESFPFHTDFCHRPFNIITLLCDSMI